MILATHILTGTLIGAKIKNPFAIIAASIVLHYLLDAIPHGEYLNQKSKFSKVWWKVTLDISVGLLLSGIILFSRGWVFEKGVPGKVILAILFSLLPDLTTLIYMLARGKVLKSLYRLNRWVHGYTDNFVSPEFNLANFRYEFAINLLVLVLLVFL